MAVAIRSYKLYKKLQLFIEFIFIFFFSKLKIVEGRKLLFFF